MQKSNFQRDLSIGQAGELEVQILFTLLQKTDGRKGDFVAPDGGVVEVKTDLYGMQKTTNFFIERYSSIETQSPGGPWQAAAHGCKYFVYFYLPDKVGFIWILADLLPQLEAIVGQLKPVEVKNKRWTTIGYKVPRALLSKSVLFSTKELKDDFGIVNGWGYGATSKPR